MGSLDFTVNFGILRLQFRTNNKTVYHWLVNYYTEPRTRDAFHEVTSPLFLIEIEEMDSPHQLVIEPVTNGHLGSIALAGSPCVYDNGRFYSHATGRLAHELEVTPATQSARINIGGEFLLCAETFLYSLVRELLAKLVLPLFGVAVLHGCVATNDRRTLFLSGTHAAGKSTTGLTMIDFGYSIVSDDSPLCFMHAGKPYLTTMLDELSVTERTLELRPGLKEWLGSKRQVSGKYFLSRRLLGDTRLHYNPVQVTHFISLRRGEYTHASLRPCERAEAVFELLRESMLVYRYPKVSRFGNALDTAGLSMIDMVSRLVTNSELYVLEYHESHGEQIAPMIADLLGENANQPKLHSLSIADSAK